MTSLVALHGFSGGPSSFDSLVHALPRSIRCLAEPLAGHLGSSREPVSIEDEADHIATLVSSLPKPVVLLGYSLGGRVVLATLARADVAGAVIVSAHPGLVDPRERRERHADDVRLAESLRVGGRDAFFDAWEKLPLFASQTSLDAETRAARSALRRSHDPGALAAALERFSLGTMTDSRPLLASLAIPLRFVAGSRDRKFTALAEEVASIAPRGRAEIIEGVGHDVILEAPLAVASIVASVFREVA